MCGRFTLAAPPKLVADLFGLEEDDLPLFEPRYNIAPTQPVVAVRLDGSGMREAVELKWGLVPSWSKDDKGAARLINARAESAAEKPSFRSAMKRRRCLVPADGYYEWQVIGKAKQPYHIRLRGGKPFAFAGLWECWRTPGGKSVETCSFLTTEANQFISRIHDRMPVIISPDNFDRWLDVDAFDVEEIKPLLTGYTGDDMEMLAVSTYVNNARHEGEECLEAAERSQSLF